MIPPPPPFLSPLYRDGKRVVIFLPKNQEKLRSLDLHHAIEHREHNTAYCIYYSVASIKNVYGIGEKMLSRGNAFDAYQPTYVLSKLHQLEK